MTRVSGGPIASKSSAFALLHAGSGTKTLCAQLPRDIGPADGYSTNVFLFLWPPVHFWTSARGTLLLRPHAAAVVRHHFAAKFSGDGDVVPRSHPSAAGWVILLPKKALVDQPDTFRPIVCGEVVLKVLAKIAMTRLVSTWPLPTCCFGACRGRGVLEALYTVKACAPEVGGLQDDTLFLQLDVSSAFDSLKLRAVLNFLRAHWCPHTAKSGKLLHWILSRSVLHFQLFDEMWPLQQQVGIQQGATHSPVLFGRMVAAKFAELCAQWEARGELPAFRSGGLSLWGIWFIDDAICFLRNNAQYPRLVPGLVQMLAESGLRPPTFPKAARWVAMGHLGRYLVFRGSAMYLNPLIWA